MEGVRTGISHRLSDAAVAARAVLLVAEVLDGELHRLLQLLGDRVELGAPADDRAGRPPQLDRQRALGLDERVERTASGCAKSRLKT